MSDDAVFNLEDAERIAEVVRNGKARPVFRLPAGGFSGRPPVVPEWWAKITNITASTVTTNGTLDMFEAALYLHDADPLATAPWVQILAPVWLNPPNPGGIANATYYRSVGCGLVGPAGSTTPAFDAIVTGLGGLTVKDTHTHSDTAETITFAGGAGVSVTLSGSGGNDTVTIAASGGTALTITDGTSTDAGASTIRFVGATVSGSGGNDTVTVNPLTVRDKDGTNTDTASTVTFNGFKVSTFGGSHSDTIGAAGADTAVQFNDGLAVAGNASFTFNKATGQATLFSADTAVYVNYHTGGVYRGVEVDDQHTGGVAALMFTDGTLPDCAGFFTSFSHTVRLCDATNAIKLVAGTLNGQVDFTAGSEVWNGAAPATVEAAIRRLCVALNDLMVHP